ncbi:TonB-dependent receptor [Riemerella anatipestifer]|nr:TonB-dependent receptor [Riemerella anatipestifer]
MNRIFNFIAAISFCGAYAQTTTVLEGVITNPEGVPISGAKVSVKNQTSLTDEMGRYRITLSGDKTYHLTVTASRYQTETLVLEQTATGVLTKDFQLVWNDTVSIPEIVMNRERKLQVNKLDIKNLEAPMSVSVLNNELMRQMDVQTMEDAARNFVGINPVNQFGAFQFFNIRGFDNFVLLYDGVRDERHNITQSAPITNIASVERIEVLKGPSGELFGHSALGGIINVIRKKPTESFRGNASASIGSYNTYNFLFGVGGSLSKKMRYRFDLSSNKTDGWRNVKGDANNASLTLQYLLNSRTQIELFAQYNKDNYAADAGVPADNQGHILKGLSPSMNFNNPNDFVTNEKKEIQLSFKHSFSKDTKFVNTLSYYDDNINYLADEVIFINPQKMTYSRYNGPFHFNHFTKPWSNQMTLNFKFNTYGIKHKALVGSVASFLNRKTLYGDISSLEKPIDVPISSQISNYSERQVNIARIFQMNEFLLGTYFHDWVEFSDRIKMLLGVRYDYFDGVYSRRRGINEPQNKYRDQFNNVSYRVGLSVQPVKDLLSIYASASNFFKPTRSHDHRTGNRFIPERGFQAETGLKLEKKNLFNVSMSGFFIRKNNVIVGHYVLSQMGGAESKGLEVDAEVTPTKGLYIKAGYAYTDTKFISKGNENNDIVGNSLPWVPKNTFNSWVNYEFQERIKGLGLGLGVYYNDKIYQNQYNDQTLPSYVLVNGAVYYRAKNNVKVSLNIENLFNNLYMRSALSRNDLYSNDPAVEMYQSVMQVYPGRDRNFKFTIAYDF